MCINKSALTNEQNEKTQQSNLISTWIQIQTRTARKELWKNAQKNPVSAWFYS